MTPIRTALAASVVVCVAVPIAWQLSRGHGAPFGRPAEEAAPTPAVTAPAQPPVPEAKPAEPAKPEIAASPPSIPQPVTTLPSPADAAAKLRNDAAQGEGDRSAAGSNQPMAMVSPDASIHTAPPPVSPITPPASSPPTDFGRDRQRSATAQAKVAARAPSQLQEHAPVPPPPPMALVKPVVPSPAPMLTRAAPQGEAPAQFSEPVGQEKFDGKPQSGFKTAQEAPVSTFSIDVDTASYGYVRASLNRNVLPPAAAVRTEELINYFPYNYPVPENRETPFKVTASVFPSPWAEGRKIVRVGIKGYDIHPETRPKANLVFLVDTSGSMNGPNRLPLVKQSLEMLLTKLDDKDRVAIVAYAGEAGTVLEPTAASDKQKILSAIEGLGAGGSTAGGEGLRQAYALAERNFDPKAVNRVMLATDGDFNVGITSQDELKGFVERKRETGIFLSVLGFGMGNTNDALMQALAQNGNGTAATIDTINEARKVLVEEATATLFPIAKDVKIQVEFNPVTVAEYRLIGYETRALNREDFENDKVDAGEIGSGQSATALYEIVPAGGPRTVAPLRYGEAKTETASKAGEYAFVKVRYKQPDQDTSKLIETPVGPAVEQSSFDKADEDARFATAVAGFGEILRGGKWTGKLKLDDVAKWASAARGEDPYGYRSEFVQLVRAAKTAQTLRPQRR
ncbi:vWA domain-containing protein [Methylobacterium sp. C25]|uniref:vWA domain-containing protein n=1 Tax=Methylobacterium sp. C25 TaxID=2721622 RepID=UPI001F40C50A|nr:VWA domain-containing protein [Methylobacterium sp. C25]